MGKVIGIDLGTTNSCVSVVENGTPVIIPSSAGGQTSARLRSSWNAPAHPCGADKTINE